MHLGSLFGIRPAKTAPTEIPIEQPLVPHPILPLIPTPLRTPPVIAVNGTMPMTTPMENEIDRTIRPCMNVPRLETLTLIEKEQPTPTIDSGLGNFFP
jgi:hypothetical protein